MKRIASSPLVTGLVAVLVAIFMFMPLHPFLATWGGTAIGPLEAWKAWKEVLLVVLSIILLVRLLLKGTLLAVMSDNLVRVMLAYLLFVLLLFATISLGHLTSSASLVGLGMDTRYVIAFLLVYVMGRYEGAALKALASPAKSYLMVVGIVLGILGIVQVALLPLDFLSQFGYKTGLTIAPYTLLDDNPDAPRAFATLRGPNDYAAFLIVPLLLLIADRRWPKYLRYSGIAVVTIGLALSGSRSAWIGTVAALLAYVATRQNPQWLSARRLLSIVVSGAMALALGLALATQVPALRLAIFHSSPDDPSVFEGSSNNHLTALLGGIDRVVANPLGCGPGCSGPASYYADQSYIAENYYVQIAEELGVVGLVLWATMFGMVMYRLFRSKEPLAPVVFAAGCGISVIGILLHVWSDDPLAIAWWMLAALVLASTARTERASHKD